MKIKAEEYYPEIIDELLRSRLISDFTRYRKRRLWQKVSLSVKINFILIKLLAFKSNHIGIRICKVVEANFSEHIRVAKNVRMMNPKSYWTSALKVYL